MVGATTGSARDEIVELLARLEDHPLLNEA